MYVVRKKDGNLTKDYREILQVQRDYYEDLYTSDPDVNFNLTNNSGVRLTPAARTFLDEDTSEAELFDAVMTLKSNKTPGCDGLTAELYRKFWKELVKPLHRMYCILMELGFLNLTGKRGIINLIPKKGKLETEVQHWRPISILMCDYKIYAKTLANRLDLVAPDLIGPQQTGFMKNQSIHTNLLTTMEITAYLNESNQPGVIAIVDFSKCFDRIEYQSIRGAFRYFGFGESFIDKMFLLFSELEMCTINNGYASDFFVKQRGVNQGCNLSPLVYTICGEVMAHLITQNSSINGISIGGLKRILSQFADDTCASLEYSRESLEQFSEILHVVETTMGLKVSYEKTLLYRVGSLANSDAMIYTSKPFGWSNDDIDTLGIKITEKGSISRSCVDEIFNKVQKTCDSWIHRSVTLMGKVLVINTLLGSLFTYKLLAMMELTDEDIKKFEQTVKGFLWPGKRPHIDIRTLEKRKDQGGLRLTSITARQDTMRISWIFKLENDVFLSNCAYRNLHEHIRQLIWKCNISEKDVMTHFNDSIWKRVLCSWSKINFRIPHTKSQILGEILWLNSNLKVGNKLVFWKTWWDKDILLISDIFNLDGSQKSLQEMGLDQSEWLKYQSLFSSIPQSWRLILKDQCFGENKHPMYDMLSMSKIKNRKIYDLLIDDQSALQKYAKRWDTIFQTEYEEYTTCFKNIFRCTVVTKFRDFQYRLLLEKLVFNKELLAWGKKDNDLCSFCGLVPETILHALLECRKIKPIMDILWNMCNVTQTAIPSAQSYLFNEIHPKADHIINFIAIVIKQFLYKVRCRGETPHVNSIQNEIVYINNIELFNAKQDGTLAKFNKRWGPIQYIVDDFK